LLSISNDDQAGSSRRGSRWSAARRPASRCGSGATAASGSAAPEPVNIEKGMTTDQVEAAMAKPDKKVTLGTKQFTTKDMKVIFLSGKVSDVQ